MPAKGPLGSSGRVGGGSSAGGRGSRGGGSARAKTPSKNAQQPGKPPTLYHGTSWKYKSGDVTKSRSASRSYAVAKEYSTSKRAGRGPWFSGKQPDPKAFGKSTVYEVRPANSKARFLSKEGSKQEYRSSNGYKIVKKVKSAPKPKMKSAAKPNPKPRKGNQR